MQMVLESPMSPARGCIIFGKTMGKKPRRRKRGIAWPDKGQWEAEFATRLLEDEKAKAAYRSLRRQGCLWGNILGYLHAYTVGFVPVTGG
jgi:hypothetical protein